MAALRTRDLARVYLRSLWLQASWSYEGMQGLGFAYALDPVLQRLHGEGPGRREALLRHLEFFNTHPVLACAVLGCVARLEEEGGAEGAAAALRMKATLMGPCGAMGDSLYWGALKPLLALLALHGAIVGQLWAPVAFVVSFGAANLGGRALALRVGYRRGQGVVEALSRGKLLRWAARLKRLSAVLLGTLMVFQLGATPLKDWDLHPAAWTAGVWGFVLAASWLVARGLRPIWMVYVAGLIFAGIVWCT